MCSCPNNNIIKGIDEGTIEMEINGQPVTSESELGKGCFLLGNRGGSIFEPNGDGRFTFRARIAEDAKGGYARISSFIVW